MLSRVAERLYWFGRYMERTENIARLIAVYSNLLLDLPKSAFIWDSLVKITGFESEFEDRFAAASERNVVKFLFDDPSCSLRATTRQARENARTTRDLMPNEVWEKMNELHYLLAADVSKCINRNRRHTFLSEIIDLCLELNGYLNGSMSRKSPYYFLKLGRNIERADMTTRVIDVACLNLIGLTKIQEAQDNILWMGVLQSLNAHQMYRQQVQDRINDVDVVDFLLKDEHFPRSVGYCISDVTRSIKHLPNNTLALMAARRVKRITTKVSTDVLLDSEQLHASIDDIQEKLSAVHSSLLQSWFRTS